MSTPRFWTDPLSGASYNFGDKLPSAQLNQILDGLRRIDYAIERNQATSLSGSVARPGEDYIAACLDEKYDQIVAVANVTASTACYCISFSPDGSLQTAGVGSRLVSGEPVGGWETTASAMASDGNGTVLLGAKTINASADKVAVSTDGEVFVVQTMNTSDAGVGVVSLIWTGSLFVAGLDGGSTTKTIETSPDGVTWTTRTNANSNTVLDWATDGAGTVVGVSTSTTDQAIRSTNGGVAWGAVTMPASAVWKSVTYSKGLGKWFATDGNTNWATSPDGSAWSAGTFTNPLGTANKPYKLASLGNILVAQDGAGDVWISDDGENFVRVADSGLSTASFRSLYASSAGWVALTNDGTDTTFRIGQIFHV